MLTRFDHVTLAVHDVDDATERYRRLFGSDPLWRGAHPELGTRAAVFGLRNGCVELLGPGADATQSEALRQWLATHGEGVQAVALGTEDAAGLSALLRSRGLRATAPQDGAAQSADGERRTYRTVELSPRQTRGLSVFAVERPDPAALLAGPATDAAHVEALDHIVIASAAPDAARALYGDGLGIRLALDTHFGAQRMLFFRIGGVTLEVVHVPKLDERDVFRGIAYRVGDLAAAHQRLHRAGFALGEPRPGNKPGTHVFTVRDGTCGVPTLILHDPSASEPLRRRDGHGAGPRAAASAARASG